jgi:stress response protein YsnF
MTDQHSRFDRDTAPAPGDARSGSEEDSSLRIPLVEETLEARVVEREQGRIVIRKRVETETVTDRVELHHDAMEIDEVEVNEEASERLEPWYEGDTLMVPVYEEVLVSYTELRLKKVVRLRNRGATELVEVEGTVRREVVDIDERDIRQPDATSGEPTLH